MIRQMVAGHCLFDVVLFEIGRILDPVPSTVLRQDDWVNQGERALGD